MSKNRFVVCLSNEGYPSSLHPRLSGIAVGRSGQGSENIACSKTVGAGRQVLIDWRA